MKIHTVLLLLITSLVMITQAEEKQPKSLPLPKLNTAKIAKAKIVCKNLQMAVEQYEDDYHFLPFVSTPAPITDTQLMSRDGIISVLAGLEELVNFKQIRYLKIDKAKKDADSKYKDGMLIKGKNVSLYDPWGNYYYIVIDYNLDGILQHPFKKDEKIEGRSAIVYSAGPDGKIGSDEFNKDNISNL